MSRSMARLAAVSALLGSTVEYFDFTLFTTASALYLGPVFFAKLGTWQAVMASLITFGLAFVARPVGAVLFGHIGDRSGRRTALIATVTVMGLATFGVGCLPGFAAAGWVAPIALVVLRLAQGLSAGGEQAGSNALTLEHAPAGRRGVFAAWTMQGTALGTVLGKLAFLGVLALPQAVQLSWGWRVPFLVAGPLLLVTLWIRRFVEEPEIFVAARRPDRLPLRDVLSRHRREVLLVAAGTLYAVGGTVLNVYGLSWATERKLLSPDSYLWVVVAATVAGLIAQPLWARLGDRFGRRPVFVAAALATAAALPGFFAALATGNPALFAVAATATNVAWSGANAVGAAQFSELFPTPVRHTGAALGGQLGMVLVGFGPAFMASLAGPGTAGWIGPALLGAGFLVVAALASLAAPETGRTPLAGLDVPAQPRNGA